MHIIESSLVHTIAPFSGSDSARHPALILVHGRGSNEEDLLGLAPYLDPRLLVISVRAPFPFSHGGYTWYTMQETGKAEPREFMESYSRLEQFLTDVRSSYPVDSEQIFLLGFSMGSMMSLGFALSRPDEVRGVVAHSGCIPEDSPLIFAWEKIASCRFFVAHGIDDPVIPISLGRRAQELLVEKGAKLTYREYPIGHHVSEDSIRDIDHWLAGILNDGPGA